MNENTNTNTNTPRRTDRAWRRQERKDIKAMAAAPARDKHEGKKRRRSIAYADYSGSTPTQALQRVSRLQAIERFFGRKNHAQRLRAFFNHREAVLRASAATDERLSLALPVLEDAGFSRKTLRACKIDLP